MAEALGIIHQAIDSRRGHGAAPLQVATVNPEFVMRARRDRRFRDIVVAAGLRTADGAGLLLAARILGRRLPERVTGLAVVRGLAEKAAVRRAPGFFPPPA